MGNLHPEAGILSGALLSIKACNSISLSSDVARSSPRCRRCVASLSRGQNSMDHGQAQDSFKFVASISEMAGDYARRERLLIYKHIQLYYLTNC
jgi:hypothetical protein